MNLQTLSLSRCSSMIELPESLVNMQNLTSLNLEGCTSLIAIPEMLSMCTKLTKLNLCNCSSLSALPDLSEVKGLENAETGLSCSKESGVYVYGVCGKLVHSWQACGRAPGCNDGMGKGYGIYSGLCLAMALNVMNLL